MVFYNYKKSKTQKSPGDVILGTLNLIFTQIYATI